jgi:polycystin 2
MFALVSYGYACAGYALFGFKLSNYETMTDSFLSLIRMLKYNYNYKELEDADPLLAPIFFTTFMLLFIIALLGMFCAIIVAHYN